MDPTEWMDVSQYMRPRDDAPAPASAPEPEGLAALVAMGFGRGAAEATLAAHGGDVGAAANALSATAHAARPAASLAAPAAPPPPVANEKAPRPRKVLLAEFEGLGREDASQALRDVGGDLDKARALIRRKREGAPAPPLAPRDSNKRASDASDGEASLECKPKKKAKPAPAPRPLDGATSPYNMALRDAVDTAVAAVAADGEPLFEEAARAALRRVTALDDDARHVLARLLFVKGPWHPVNGSRASLDSYAGGDATTVRAALEAAGALVVLQESSPLADASEALPTLVADEVKRVVAALKESAPNAWKAAKKRHKGATKDAHVAVARAVAATLADENALAFLVADEKALVRIDRGVETALLRALRFAERRGGFLGRPAPPTRRLQAVLQPPHLRSPEAPPTIGTPMFRTRGHFERTEGVAGLAHAASIAAAIANGDAWGEEVIELLEVYERCNAPAGLAAFDAFRRPSSLTGPAHALGVVDDGAPAVPRALCAQPDEHAAVETLKRSLAERKKAYAALEKAEKTNAALEKAESRKNDAAAEVASERPTEAAKEAVETARARKDAATEAVKEDLVLVAAAARAVAEALAAACLRLLAQNAADADHVASLPAWLQGYDAGKLLARAAWHGVEFLQKDKRYAEANDVLRTFLDHGHRRGACHVRLLINLKHLGEDRTQALANARRDCPEGTVARWKIDATAGEERWRAPALGARVDKSAVDRVGAVGSRLLYEDVDAEDADVVEVDAEGAPAAPRLVLVEHLAGNEAGKEGWNSWHDEGAALRTVCYLLLWDQARLPVKDAFFAPFQGAPCDWGTQDFHERRKASMDARLAEIAACAPTELAALVNAAFDARYGEVGLVHWRGREAVAKLQIVAACFGGKAVAGIALHLAVTGLRSGMPDNTMVRATRPTGECVDVKAWPLADERVVPPLRVLLAQTQLQHCQNGAAGLEDGAALELRLEQNPRAPRIGAYKGLAFAIHDAATGEQCGYVANADMDRVRAPTGKAPEPYVAGAAVQSEGGWLIEVPSPAPRDVVVPADWTYEGKIVEVKSKNDALWSEQRMWIRVCNEEDYLHYDNPYLFEDDDEGGRIGTVDISITVVKEKGGGRKKGVAGGHAGMEVEPAVAGEG